MSRSRINDRDRDEVAVFVEKHWRSRRIMSHGQAYFPHEQDGFIERIDGEIVGLLTFRRDDGGMEILTLNATRVGQRIGTSLMLAAIQTARDEGRERVWLTTTNDNLRAIGFYQRIGFRMCEINIGAVDQARQIKPEIPEHGERGIPIHDEVVMELQLQPYLDEGGAGEADSVTTGVS